MLFLISSFLYASAVLLVNKLRLAYKITENPSNNENLTCFFKLIIVK